MLNKIILQFLLLSFASLSHSLPLSTSSRWIIDESTGCRVKLSCANWAAHLEPMLPEGLDKRPVGDLAKHVAEMGFNCVRLTWATYMFTRYDNLTVAQSFSRLGLENAMEGIAQNNPLFLNYTVVEAQKAVVEELGAHGVMVVLDNQISKPMWCCSDNDGNGFFGDEYFDVEEWLEGWKIVAKSYIHTPMVVGMSLRNELRGPHQNESAWYQYIRIGAKTIHESNPNVLVIVSGLNYDLDLSFLKKTALNLNFTNKIVYEAHRYSFSSGRNQFWLNQTSDLACETLIQEIQSQVGFLVEGENAAPLFLSEFGINQLGQNRADNLFLGCFLGYLADMDLDWSIWALHGSYYLRDGLHGSEETYGMLDSNWSSLRSPEFHQKLQLIQQKIQDPKSKGQSYYILFHPSTGRCIKVQNSEIHATDCRSFSQWTHAGNTNPIWLMGTQYCLSAAEEGNAVTLSTDCSKKQSQWELVSNSSFQLANKKDDGTYWCLDWNQDYSSTILTKKCLCLEDGSTDCQENLQSQWFKLILANVQT